MLEANVRSRCFLLRGARVERKYPSSAQPRRELCLDGSDDQALQTGCRYCNPARLRTATPPASHPGKKTKRARMILGGRPLLLSVRDAIASTCAAKQPEAKSRTEGRLGWLLPLLHRMPKFRFSQSTQLPNLGRALAKLVLQFQLCELSAKEFPALTLGSLKS